MVKIKIKDLQDKTNNIVSNKKLDIKISPQAQAIITSYDNFPIDHFLNWWKEHFLVINGQQLHQYFATAIKEALK